MKQRRSKQEMKERRSKMLFGIITILVMVSGGVAIFADSIGTKENFDYNGYDFKSQNDMWITETGDEELVFVSHPLDVEYMPLDERIINVFSQEKGIYMTSDENDFAQIDQVKSYFMSHLYYDFGVVSSNAVTFENDFNVSVINCSNATEDNPVVYFEKSSSTGFGYQDNCVTLMAPTELGLVRLSDRVLYSLHGIIED